MEVEWLGWKDLTRDGRVEEASTSETFREQSIHNTTHELLTVKVIHCEDMLIFLI